MMVSHTGMTLRTPVMVIAIAIMTTMNLLVAAGVADWPKGSHTFMEHGRAFVQLPRSLVTGPRGAVAECARAGGRLVDLADTDGALIMALGAHVVRPVWIGTFAYGNPEPGSAGEWRGCVALYPGGAIAVPKRRVSGVQDCGCVLNVLCVL